MECWTSAITKFVRSAEPLRRERMSSIFRSFNAKPFIHLRSFFKKKEHLMIN
jgi:hypothetical protein